MIINYGSHKNITRAKKVVPAKLNRAQIFRFTYNPNLIGFGERLAELPQLIAQVSGPGFNAVITNNNFIILNKW